MSKLFLSVGLSLLIFIFTFAQEKQPKVNHYKAPKYPPAAEATHTQGEVNVTVKINKDGNVTSAKAENGHPFLRSTTENIASQWIFSSSKSVYEREAKLSFSYIIKYDKREKNANKETRYKIKFKKPYRLEITAFVYLRIDY